MTQDSGRLAQPFIDALHVLEEAAQEETGVAVDGLAQLFAENARLTNAAMQLTGETRAGREQIREFWTEYKKTVGKARSHFHQVTGNDEAVGLFWTTKGEDKAWSYEGVTPLEFDGDGKISRFHGYYDTQALDRALERIAA